MNHIAPSMLSADFANLERDMTMIKAAGADWLHVDVMDGVFVPNITIGAPVVKALRKVSDLFFDVHLMITAPERYIDDFAAAGADSITVHYESFENKPKGLLAETLDAIRAHGIRAGISVKPATDATVLQSLLEKLDLILIMTVEPGFGGQAFMPELLPKIKKAREMADAADHEIIIEVDGGINTVNIGDVVRAGANAIVAGNAIFGAEDPAAVIAVFRNAL